MTDEHQASPRSPLFRTVLLAVLVVTTLSSAALLVWATTSAGRPRSSRRSARRSMSVGEQFMLRKETFGPDLLDEQGTMPEYREQVHELITPKFADQLRRGDRAGARSWSRRAA